MKAEVLRVEVLKLLKRIAPEAVLSELDPATSLRSQLDLDSMDFLNFVISLAKELHVDVPERDYGQLSTLDRCVNYLLPRVVPAGNSCADPKGGQ